MDDTTRKKVKNHLDLGMTLFVLAAAILILLFCSSAVNGLTYTFPGAVSSFQATGLQGDRVCVQSNYTHIENVTVQNGGTPPSRIQIYTNVGDGNPLQSPIADAALSGRTAFLNVNLTKNTCYYILGNGTTTYDTEYSQPGLPVVGTDFNITNAVQNNGALAQYAGDGTIRVILSLGYTPYTPSNNTPAVQCNGNITNYAADNLSIAANPDAGMEICADSNPILINNVTKYSTDSSTRIGISLSNQSGISILQDAPVTGNIAYLSYTIPAGQCRYVVGEEAGQIAYKHNVALPLVGNGANVTVAFNYDGVTILRQNTSAIAIADIEYSIIGGSCSANTTTIPHIDSLFITKTNETTTSTWITQGTINYLNYSRDGYVVFHTTNSSFYNATFIDTMLNASTLYNYSLYLQGTNGFFDSASALVTTNANIPQHTFLENETILQTQAFQAIGGAALMAAAIILAFFFLALVFMFRMPILMTLEAVPFGMIAFYYLYDYSKTQLPANGAIGLLAATLGVIFTILGPSLALIMVVQDSKARNKKRDDFYNIYQE